MKVIHLPYNVASQASISVRGLRSLGVEARGLVRDISTIQDNQGLDTVDWHRKVNPISRPLRSLRWRWKLWRALAWADLIHWHWGESTWRGWDLKLAAWTRKPRLIEFWGDDLRHPDLASQDNPYIARMYQHYPELRNHRSVTTQQLFQRHGFQCLIPGVELMDYLHPSFFPHYHRIRARIMTDDFEPHYPDPTNLKPLIVHAPSHKERKGTEAVLAAIAHLQPHFKFEFRLIHEMPRSAALELVRQCDLFLDQFTIGAEGMASIEAMAFGKPAVCYIKPTLAPRYPGQLPLVIATQDNLTEVVRDLLRQGPRRHEIGLQSRHYVEEYYDARKVCALLLNIYNQLLAKAPTTF